MLVLNGKKLKYCVLSFFVISMIVAISLNSKNEKEKNIETVSLPVSGKVVVVDARSWDS